MKNKRDYNPNLSEKQMMEIHKKSRQYAGWGIYVQELINEEKNQKQQPYTMNQDEHEKLVGRKLSPPYLLQMDSCQKGKNCDLYNFGSLQVVRECEQGFKWVDGRVDAIPNEFSTKKINEKPEIKVCHCCQNEFELEFPFISDSGQETCLRCFERKNIINREAYRSAILLELEYEKIINKK